MYNQNDFLGEFVFWKLFNLVSFVTGGDDVTHAIFEVFL